MQVCGACGAENPAHARFCLACGSAIAAAAPARAESRKTVTVVFSDVSGSTELGERLDPEAIRHVMSRYFDEAKGVLERHGGTVEKFIGDAVMAVFGIPVVREDDALRAVRAAVDLRSSLQGLNRELEQQWGARLEVRTGVNTGEVVAADAADGQAFATGDPVNVAARLEQAAQPGEILIGETTYRLVRWAVETESVPPVAAKGKREPVAAWRLLGVADDAPAVERHLDVPMVGRRVELATLEQALAGAVEGRSCRLCTVLGSPGIGKSRLAAELVRRVRDEATVLVGRCPPYGEGTTYWPLRELVFEAAPGGDRAAIRALLAEHADADLVADRVAASIGATDASAAGEDTFWAVRTLFETLARRAPLVILFEDIQWAEPTFLDLTEYLAAWSSGAILLLCLARPELLDTRPQWPRGEALITLAPLSDEESRALVEQRAEADGLSPDVRARITAAAEGNPLFIEQMLAMLDEEGSVFDPAAVPPTVEALLAARLDHLPAPERAVLERAAVVGREFWRGGVLALSPEEERPAVPAHLLALVRRELIAPDRSALPREDALRFRHVLIRNAAYNSLPKRVRADLHERCAEWLEGAVGESIGEYEEIVGLHLEESYRYRAELQPLDDAQRALARGAAERLASAGLRALARSDVPAAAKLLGRAAALLPADDPERLELLPRLATALVDNGELTAAENVLAEAVERAAAAGRGQLEARARLEHLYVSAHARPEVMRAEISALAAATIPLLEAEGDDEGLARAWYLSSEDDWFANRMERRTEALERALVHARRAGDRRGEAELLYWLALALFTGPTPAAEGLARCDRLVDEAHGATAVEQGIRQVQAGFLALQGRIDEGREIYRASRDEFQELGLVFRAALGTLLGSEIEMLGGDPAAAERELRWGYDVFRSMGETGTFSTVSGTLANVLYALGRYDDAEAMAVESRDATAADDLYSHVLWRGALAGVRAQRGAFADAERLAREAVELGQFGDSLFVRGDTLMRLAEVLLLAGRPEEALEHVEEALRLYERKQALVQARAAEAELKRLRSP